MGWSARDFFFFLSFLIIFFSKTMECLAPVTSCLQYRTVHSMIKETDNAQNQLTEEMRLRATSLFNIKRMQHTQCMRVAPLVLAMPVKSKNRAYHLKRIKGVMNQHEVIEDRDAMKREGRDQRELAEFQVLVTADMVHMTKTTKKLTKVLSQNVKAMDKLEGVNDDYLEMKDEVEALTKRIGETLSSANGNVDYDDEEVRGMLKVAFAELDPDDQEEEEEKEKTGTEALDVLPAVPTAAPIQKQPEPAKTMTTYPAMMTH